MIRAAVFDFGLVISTPRPPSRFRAYERELGLDEGTINRIMFDSPAWHDALCGRMTMAAYWRAVGPSLGLTTPPAIDAFRRRYYSDEAANQEVLAIVRGLHGCCRLAILSNHPPGLGCWLRDWGIDRLFDVVYCSGDEGHVKPEPVVYQATLERLGVLADEAVFIDDTPGHVAAARALGIVGIVFTGARQLGQELKALLDRSEVSRTRKA